MSSPSLLAAGTFVVDYHKLIRHFPEERSSARVIREEVSPGGAPFNLLINLSQLGTRANLHASSRIGRDLDGQYVLDRCRSGGIAIDQIHADRGVGTGYTDVFTVEPTGKHTCFHFDGACMNFSRRDVKMRAIENLEYLFLGSLGALGKLGQSDPDTGRSQAAQLLYDASKRGVQTIVEFAPLEREVDLQHFAPALRHADFVFLNDRDAARFSGIDLYTEDHFDPSRARLAAERFLQTGPRRAVIIQSGTGAVYLSADGSFQHRSGYFLPWDQRVGSAGVDHAFCAGFIEGLMADKPVETCLDQGLAVSTVCRTDLTPSGAIGRMDRCLEFCAGLAPFGGISS